jgi:hypothetical protein
MSAGQDNPDFQATARNYKQYKQLLGRLNLSFLVQERMHHIHEFTYFQSNISGRHLYAGVLSRYAPNVSGR